MNKGQLIEHISERYGCTKAEATKTIEMFTSTVIDVLGSGEEISLVGFGSFSINKYAARTGRNPQTGEAIKIAAYNLPKFRAGQRFKDAVNKEV